MAADIINQLADLELGGPTGVLLANEDNARRRQKSPSRSNLTKKAPPGEGRASVRRQAQVRGPGSCSRRVTNATERCWSLVISTYPADSLNSIATKLPSPIKTRCCRPRMRECANADGPPISGEGQMGLTVAPRSGLVGTISRKKFLNRCDANAIWQGHLRGPVSACWRPVLGSISLGGRVQRKLLTPCHVRHATTPFPCGQPIPAGDPRFLFAVSAPNRLIGAARPARSSARGHHCRY